MRKLYDTPEYIFDQIYHYPLMSELKVSLQKSRHSSAILTLKWLRVHKLILLQARVS